MDLHRTSFVLLGSFALAVLLGVGCGTGPESSPPTSLNGGGEASNSGVNEVVGQVEQEVSQANPAAIAAGMAAIRVVESAFEKVDASAALCLPKCRTVSRLQETVNHLNTLSSYPNKGWAACESARFGVSSSMKGACLSCVSGLSWESWNRMACDIKKGELGDNTCDC